MTKRRSRAVVCGAIVLATAGGCGISVIGTGGGAGDDDGGGGIATEGSVDGGDASTSADGAMVTSDAAAPDAEALDASAGCDADLQTNATNCGACGHDCKGAACTNGLCAPSSVVTYAPGVRSVATNSTRLYFTSDVSNSIFWLPLSNLSATPMLIMSGLSNPCEIAVDDADLYWVSCGASQARHATLDGQNDALVASNISGCIYLGPDGNGYGASFSNNDLVRFTLSAPLTQSTVVDASEGVALPWGVAATATDIFWTNSQDDGGVFHRPIAGGARATVASGQGNPNCISFADGLGYWPNYNNGEVHRARPDGSGQQILATGLDRPTSVAFDPSWIYWNSGGSIMRVAR
jgi:hypothetical protein